VLRFCIPCGVSKGRYTPGSQVPQRDKVRFVCRACKELRGGKFCERCAICSHCDCSGARLERCEGERGRGGHCIIDKTRRSEASVCCQSELGVCVSRTIITMASRTTAFIAMHCKSR
jgi:hypothetical protein